MILQSLHIFSVIELKAIHSDPEKEVCIVKIVDLSENTYLDMYSL